MSEKIELTIQLPSLHVVDNHDKHWCPFDETERFYRGDFGYACESCKQATYKGFKRGLTFKPVSMSYLCNGCVTLINPWESPND